MYAPSPAQTSVYDQRRRERLDKVAQYRLAEAACRAKTTRTADATPVRIGFIRSRVQAALNALSPVSFGLSSR